MFARSRRQQIILSMFPQRGWCSTGLIAMSLALLIFSTRGCRRSPPAGALAKLHSCRLPEIKGELLCGKLHVFENRRTRTGRTIDLNIVVLPAFDQKTKTEPLFDLAGGPGVASTGSATFYATEGKEYRRRHDVVLVDQRGTGKSDPLSIPQKKTPQHYLSECIQSVTSGKCVTRWSSARISRNTQRQSRWMISTMCEHGSVMTRSIFSAGRTERRRR